MSTAKAIEEYPPGPGHANTLDGYRQWSEWRNEQEQAKRRRREEETRREIEEQRRAREEAKR